MSETTATAMLVGTREMFATRPNVLTATVARGEIEGALALDPPAELILDVVRGPDGAERRTVNVAWTRTDLESVLDDPGADAITFSFDPAELEQALEGSEVEGHGLRETAVVLSIAAAAAASGASGAFGAVHDEASSSQRGIATPIAAAAHTEMGSTERGIATQASATAHDEASLAARGIDAGTPAATHDEASYAARGIEPGTLPAVHDETTLAARGIDAGTPAATHDEASYAARGIEPGTLAAVHDETTLAARGIDTGAPAVHDETTLAARGIEPGPVPAVHDETTLTARGIDTGPALVADTGSGFELPSVDDGTVATIAGGLAGAGLLIAAAAFATRRREPGTV